MAHPPKILAFAGSTRSGSFNKKLIRLGAAAAEKAGAQVTLIDLRDLPLPLYDGDLETEQGLPANALKFKDLLKSHEGFLISAPEYNSSITGVLKNTIDWASRGEDGLAGVTGKVAALMSASPGALGGLRGLVTVRSILGNIGVLVLPKQIAVSRAHEAFDEAGHLKDPKVQGEVEKVASDLVRVTTDIFSSKK